jgi:helicase
VLRTYLLSLIATDFVSSKKQIFDFFAKTFWAHQFRDEKTIQKIILKMLKLLEENRFIKSSKKHDDFVSASELGKDEKYEATLLGKRIAELYIDPLSAIMMMDIMKKAVKKEHTDMTFLYMICKTLELRPLLNVKISEYDKIQNKLAEHEDFLFEKFDEYNEDYDVYLNSFKTSLLLKDWIEEKDEEFLLEEYNVRPGELNIKVSNSDWMLYSAEEIARILNFKSILSKLKKLRIRVECGAKEELLTLLKLKNIGRVRARKLYNNGFTNLGKLRKAELADISAVVGKNIALSIKLQLGEKVNVEVKEEKDLKLGQHNLSDYS